MGAGDADLLGGGATDMRKGFEGLYGLARDRLLCEPLSGHVFLFANESSTRWLRNTAIINPYIVRA